MKKSFFFIFLVFSISLFSQKEVNTWYFGLQAGIDFNSGKAVPLLDGKTNAYGGGSASISSASGELLFYTDGQTIYNKNHLKMLNGDGINGSVGSTQTAIIIPKPADINICFLFTTDNVGGSNGLQYSEVDMRLDNGLGGVTTNKNILLTTPVTEKLTAVKSTSFNGYWIVTHKWNSDKFIVYKVTTSGVDTNPTEYNVGSFLGGIPENAGGQLKLAPTGLKLAMATSGNMNELQFFDFNPSTGEISNPSTLIDEDANTDIYGVEFSPDGKLLYVAGDKNGVFQYNLEAGNITDILASKLKLNTFNREYASLQLAPDGKIYVAKAFYEYIDYIESPDVLGMGCEYREERGGLYLGGKRSGKGFPQFIQSYFFIGFTTEKLCFGDSTQFTANISESYDSILWNFGDGNTSKEENPTHSYNQIGSYSVTLTVISGSNTSVETKEIIIYKTPTASKPLDLLICDANNDGFHNFNLNTQTNTILNGQLSTEFQVDYFASMLNYANDTKISDYTSYQNTTAYQEEVIIARVRNKGNSDCEIIIEFKIQVFETPRPKLSTEIPNLSFCDNTSVGNDTDGKILFDLTNQATEILNGQSDEIFLISYFLDENLTQQITKQTNYENLNLQQRIYAKVVNKLNTTCFAKTSFLLEVFELPIINSSVSLKQCDNADINGFSSINLNESKSKIVTNLENYTITFFEEKTLAESNFNPIPNAIAYTNQNVSNDKVWARVENANGCFRLSEVNLIVSTTQIPLSFLKTFYKCDNGIDTNDGVSVFNFSTVTQEVKDLFPANQQLIINYYENEADALAEQNKITDISNYQNTTSPNQQDIYIRVDSKLDNDCLGLGHHITLYVEKVPVANPVFIKPECDNDRDGLYAFDTSAIQTTIMGSQSNGAVSYFDENGMKLSSPLPNPFVTSSQNITARIVNTNSQDKDWQCFDETTLNFIVNSVPIANSVLPQEQCDDNTDGIFAFDTSTIEATILRSQTGLIVKYFDENNVSLPSPLPNPFTTASQAISVRLENPVYDVCYEETTINFIVREKPKVSIIQQNIICVNDNPQLQLEVENPNVNYSYTWWDENNTIVGNSAKTIISKGGMYSVTAISMYGCDSDKVSITIKESSVSTISLNDLVVQDDSDNNFIKVNTSNLGLGNYEFRLLDANKNILVDYQEESDFENLDGGNYIIEVNDKNSCGSVLFEVSLISFPKFFTPNGDGKNDIWQIKGLEKGFYKSGEIIVFNRFGKKITKFTINDIGWDGTYNGKILQSNDYWFKVVLIDIKDIIKIRTGNFSLLRN